MVIAANTVDSGEARCMTTPFNGRRAHCANDCANWKAGPRVASTSRRDQLCYFRVAATSRMLQSRNAIIVRNVARAGADEIADDLLVDRTAVAEDHRRHTRGPAGAVV